MASGTITRLVAASLDRIASLFVGAGEKDGVRAKGDPIHLEVGRRGEELAYFYLREQGYTVVARNWRNPRRKGELDIVGWHEQVLCFVEVKTRTKKAFVP